MGVVKFVAMGDTGKGNQGQYDVASAIAKKCAADGCDFVQLLGDNIYDSGVSSTSDEQWQSKFELPYADVDMPFWVVLGNHDYGGEGIGLDFARGKNEIDYTNFSTKWTLPAAYYTHSLNHVDFFALDTNMAMFLQAENQKNDVPGWIAASTAQWKIAFGHHPYLSNGPHGNAGEYEGLPFVPIVNGAGVKELLDDVICGRVDMYICGHDHSMQWLVPTCGGLTELVVTGAGASTSDLEGNNQVYIESLDVGFFYVVIQDNVLTGEFINAAGTVLYSRTITK
jgi:tartrate-resistant acid phosphatase type 5